MKMSTKLIRTVAPNMAMVAAVALLLIGCGVKSPKLSYPQVATGQVTLYDGDGAVVEDIKVGDALYGQDAHYLAGAPMSYRDNGDGTVSDLNTGLMWQMVPVKEGFNWQGAKDYCESLELGGYDDWRMPTAKELYSISDFNRGWPYINTDYFELVDTQRVGKDEQYWTDHLYLGSVGNGSAAFGVNHGTGHIKAYGAGGAQGGQGGAAQGRRQSSQSSDDSQAERPQRSQSQGQGQQRAQGERPQRDTTQMAEGGERPQRSQSQGQQRAQGGQGERPQRDTTQMAEGGERPQRSQSQREGQQRAQGGQGERPQRDTTQMAERGERPQRSQSQGQGQQRAQGGQSQGQGQQRAQGGQSNQGSGQRAQGGQSSGMGGVGGRGQKYVRAVRGEVYGVNNFVDNGDGTVTDRATGLMWAQADSEVGMDWIKALQYAEESELAGYDDWRLPNVKELQGILCYDYAPDATDPAKEGAAIDPAFFTTSQIVNESGDTDYPYVWTGTSALFQRGRPYYYAWYVAFGRAVDPSGKDSHGAGAVRFDTKHKDGPAGEDSARVNNYVRLVRVVK